MAAQKKRQSPADRLAERRSRLQSLQNRREAIAENPTADAIPGKPEGDGLGKMLKDRLTNTGQSKIQSRQMMMLKVYKMLADNATAGSDMVPGTPFTADGVAKMMDMLRKRAAMEDLKGSSLAAGFVTYLAGNAEEEAVVGGASVKKLQLLAKLVNRPTQVSPAPAPD